MEICAVEARRHHTHFKRLHETACATGVRSFHTTRHGGAITAGPSERAHSQIQSVLAQWIAQVWGAAG